MLCRLTSTSRRLAVAVLSGAIALSACGNDGGATTDVEAFCAQASANQALIIKPPLGDQEEINETIEFYDLMRQLAPIEIEDDWLVLLRMLNTANQIVPGDQDSEQLVAQTAYASELAAYNISTWVTDNCGISLPITTIVPHASTPLAPPYDPYTPPATTDPTASTPDGVTPLGTVPVDPGVDPGADPTTQPGTTQPG